MVLALFRQQRFRAAFGADYGSHTDLLYFKEYFFADNWQSTFAVFIESFGSSSNFIKYFAIRKFISGLGICAVTLLNQQTPSYPITKGLYRLVKLNSR